MKYTSVFDNVYVGYLRKQNKNTATTTHAIFQPDLIFFASHVNSENYTKTSAAFVWNIFSMKRKHDFPFQGLRLLRVGINDAVCWCVWRKWRLHNGLKATVYYKKNSPRRKEPNDKTFTHFNSIKDLFHIEACHRR